MQCYRDEEKRDLCLSYLNGISVFQFGLSLNVSTLNRWQPRPLVLSGYWRDTNPEIDIGGDVVADIAEEPPAPDFVRTLSEPIPEVGGLGYVRRGLLNEDEALKLILQSSSGYSEVDQCSLSLQFWFVMWIGQFCMQIQLEFTVIFHFLITQFDSFSLFDKISTK